MPKRKKSKASCSYFSDSETVPAPPKLESKRVRRVEQVDSYSKVDGKLRVSSGTLETKFSPRKPKASLSGGRARASLKETSPEVDDDQDEMLFLGAESHMAQEPGKENAETSESSKKKRKKRKKRSSPLLDFVPKLDVCLDEMLRLEGLGDLFGRAKCMSCQANVACPEEQGYRCLDCHPNALWCKACCIKSHALTYLHRVQMWTGACFERISLHDLGLRVQLGHLAGEVCPHLGKDPGADFVIIDGDGIHTVKIDYCQCHHEVDRIQQLLRARLFPATALNPRTAATFRVLETFQMVSATGKVSAYEFLLAIQRRTDSTTTFSVKTRNREWMRMIHLFRHLRLAKRGGRGHAISGVKGTKEGELAVLCPACPQPNINMPDGWESLPKEDLWIHALFLAIDANFRLKRKCASSDENDPGLNHGFAYIVAEVLFKAFLQENEKKVKEEKSTCNNHDAIKSAQIRGGKGEKAASGLGACQCSRHDMKRPCGAGDLQKGERYLNMDYFCLSTLRFAILLILVISYDIACQWSRNLRARCAAYPPNPISQNPGLKTVFCVPKFHAPAHVLSCRVNYSFNLTPGVGRTDGEAPERGWASSDPLATSTREMGPGRRRDTIDDFWGFLNWWKTVEIAENLAHRGRHALAMNVKQVNAFKTFAASIPEGDRKKWTEQVLAWEKDRTRPNPHENPEISKLFKFRYRKALLLNPSLEIDVKKTRKKLADEDQNAIKAGLVERVHQEMTGSMFILEGIDIEEAQRRVQLEWGKLGDHSVDIDRSKAQEHANSLHRKIKQFIDMRRVFLPSTSFTESGEAISDAAPSDGDGDEEATDGQGDDPWLIELDLPSDLLAQNRGCDRRFVWYEFLFRHSQAHVVLKELRALLLQQDHMVLSKKKYTRGTAMLTMSNALLQDIGARIKEEKRRYRDIHRRLSLLWDSLKKAGPLDDVKEHSKWMNVLQVLNKGDAKGLTCLDGNRLGEGEKTLAWIWKVGADVHETANISLRVEFCRTRARAQRWQEECLLLAEEMRRVERFLEWDAKRWQVRASEQVAVSEGRAREQAAKDKEEGVTRDPPTEFQKSDCIATVHGKIAYAVRQARIRYRMLQVAGREQEGLPDLLEKGPPLVECVEREVSSLLPKAVIPKRPMRPGGRNHKSYQAVPDQDLNDEESSDEEWEEEDLVMEDQDIPPEEQEMDPGKTYDDTDDEGGV